MVPELSTWNINEQPREKFAVARPVLSMKRTCRARAAGAVAAVAPQHLWSRKEKLPTLTPREKNEIDVATARGPCNLCGDTSYARGSGPPTAAATVRVHLDFLDCTDEIFRRCIILSVNLWLTFFACVRVIEFLIFSLLFRVARIGKNTVLWRTVTV